MTFTSGVFCVWAGLIVGLSFVATPAKFLAPSVSLADALQIGSVTFGVFKWLELAMLCLCAGLCLRRGVDNRVRAVLVVLGGVLAIQYLYLLPAMDLRVASIGAGRALEASMYHTVYVALELFEVAVLLAGARMAGAACRS